MLSNKEKFGLTETHLREKIYSEILRCESDFNIRLKLRFIRTPVSFIGTFGDKMTLSVNLSAFDFSDCLERNEIEFFYEYFTRYVVEYIELIAVSIKNKPSDYLEGLAAVGAFLRLNECGEIKMCVPLMSERLKEKKCRYFSPSDLYCSVNAFCKTLNSFDGKPENQDLEKKKSVLCSWGNVPEIYYCGSGVPFYSSVGILRDTARAEIKKNGGIYNSAFYGRFIDEIRSMTITELAKDGVLNGNPLSTGLAVRLLSFMNSRDIEIILGKEESRHNLENAISEFGLYASDFIKVCSGTSSGFLKDNSAAVNKMMKELNRISGKYGLNIKNGNVHPVFP